MSAWATMLDQLVRERGPALFGYAYVLTGSRSRAEDVLHDALVRTFRSGRGTASLDAAHAYVKRAIATTVIDESRKAARRPRTSGVDPGDVPTLVTSPDHAISVAEVLDLREALLSLPPRERACVVLRYLDDQSIAGVAQTLGLAEGTVKRYLSDGLARLRAIAPSIDFSTHETTPVDHLGARP